MVLLGSGAAVSFPASMTLPTSDADASEAGLASGLVNTTLQVGGALGLAVLATLAADRTDSLQATGTATAEALVQGYRLALIVAAALVAAAIAVVVGVLRRERQPAAAPGEPVCEPA